MKVSNRASTKDDLEPTLENTAQIHINLLKFAGILPFNKDFSYHIIEVLLVLFGKFCVIFRFSTTFWDMGKSVNEGSIDVGSLPFFIGGIGILLRYIILHTKRTKVSSILQFSKELWMNLNDFEKITTRNFMKKSVRLCYWYLIVCSTLVFFHLISSQLLNLQSNGTQRRHLMFPFFTDVQSTPWYELLVTLQFISHSGLDLIFAAIDTTATFFIMAACGYLKSLSCRVGKLSEIDDSLGQRNVEKEIINCIIFHKKIIEYIEKIRDTMSQYIFVQLLSTTYNISLDILTISKRGLNGFQYVPVLAIQTTQLLLCHIAPDYLDSESEYFSQSTFFVPYSGFSNKKLNQLIHILILRAQYPICFSAGGFFSLSMESFKKLITSAWSFFTLLHSFN